MSACCLDSSLANTDLSSLLPDAPDSTLSISRSLSKITCLLDNERDIESVLSGASGKSELKSVLARLESRQQALIFGHAVPMPVVVRTEDWGSEEGYARFAPPTFRARPQRRGRERP